MASLDSIGLTYGTDKASSGHDYLSQIYELLTFGSPVKVVVEFGVHLGASLKTFRDFFPGAVVYGVDIRSCPFRGIHPRVKFIRGDYRHVATPVPDVCDLIIDDASHVAHDILAGFAAHGWRVRAGGYYVMEDLHVVPQIHQWISHGSPAGWEVHSHTAKILVLKRAKK
jgi:cephalosporin hydroxylase